MIGRLAASLAAGVVAAGLLAACGGGSAAPAAPVATSQVDLPRSYEFRPAVITVTAGTTVKWTNHDNFTHTVRLTDNGTHELGTMSPGQSLTHTFNTPGTYHYDCSLHPQDMHGEVIVT